MATKLLAVVVLCMMMMMAVSVSAVTTPLSLEENIITYCEALNKANSGDAEWHRQYFREDGGLEWHFHADHTSAPNVEAVAVQHAKWYTDIPDIKLTIIESFSAGNNAAVRLLVSSEMKGVSGEFAGIFTGVGSKIKLGRWYTDYSHFFKELGLYDPCADKDKEL
jgi:hypothetical protein